KNKHNETLKPEVSTNARTKSF
ncbi:unnamed protein product, partial [Allacma fusca]